jgi:hypothetical protein
MANDSNEAMSLFETAPAEQAGSEYHSDAPAKQANPVALVGAVLSFLPPLGLVLSAIGYMRSRSRMGAGRIAALIGIVLAVVFGGVEAYAASTAPLLDSGCRDANSAADRLRALQASPGGNLAVLAAELDSIHTTLAGAADKAGSAQVRTRIDLVAGDVEALSVAVMNAKTTGDMSQMVIAENKLITDGNAADSYCHSL